MKTGILAGCIAAASLIVIEAFIVLHTPRFNPPASSGKLPSPVAAVPAVAAVTAPERAERVQPAPREYALELELRGTLTDCPRPVAFIKDLRSGTCKTYGAGELIREARIVRIGKGEVLFDVGGLSRRLGITGGGGAPRLLVEEIAPGMRVVKTGELFRERKEIFRELKDVRVSPQYDNKSVRGVLIEGVADGGIITSAGIRNNDVIREINDQRITSYQKALQVFLKARSQKEIKVTLTRGGELKNLSYRLQ